MQRGVTLIGGQARFLDPHTLETVSPDGARQRLSAGAFIVACGSRPYRPPDVDFTHPRIFDSDTIMHLDDSPQSITVYGAGVIGCEDGKGDGGLFPQSPPPWAPRPEPAITDAPATGARKRVILLFWGICMPTKK